MMLQKFVIGELSVALQQFWEQNNEFRNGKHKIWQKLRRLNIFNLKNFIMSYFKIFKCEFKNLR